MISGQPARPGHPRQGDPAQSGPAAAAASAGQRTTAPRGKSGTPRGHWLLVVMFALTTGMWLLVQGYTHGVVGEAPGAAAASVRGMPLPPPRIANGGPVVDTTGRAPRSLSMPPRTIALTFDDGPDPVWTPRILAVLRRYGAHATFFEIGAKAAENPGLVRQVLRSGNEIGSHTYTHPDLGTAGWRRGLELTLAQNALAGTAGIRTWLLRFPYSSEPDALTGPQWRAVQRAGRDGYLTVFADHDTTDWARPGVSRILAAAMPHGGAGEVVMMHDGGGNRAQTVAGVSKLLAALRGKGYRFETITAALHLPSADVPATWPQRLSGGALVAFQWVSAAAVSVLTWLLVAAAVLGLGRFALLVGFARRHELRGRQRRRRPAVRYVGPVSVIVPAYNEAAGIAATVRSLCDTRYPGELEVIVVDDGSTDGTAQIADGLNLPQVHVVRQANAGKPAALNTGIALARHEAIVMVDGDTVFEPTTLGHLVAPLAQPRVGAVSGNTKVANRGGLLGRWQHIEYVIGFNLDRRMFHLMECMPTIPGAIGAFRKQAIAEAGGLSGATLAEDTDLTMAICRAGYRVLYEERALAWTEAPSTLRQLWRQRYRWCYGTLQAMWKHKRAPVQGGPAGRFGRRCLPYLAIFQYGLPLIAPAMDVFALYGLLVLSPLRTAGVWAAFTVLQVLIGAYAFGLDRERGWVLWALPLQQVVYRQLMYLVGIQSLATAVTGARLHWQRIPREGTGHTLVPAGRV